MWLNSNFHRKVKIFTLTVFIYLTSPLLLLCVLTLFLYRGIISLYARLSRKDLAGMIPASTSIYASDELYGIPNQNTVALIFLRGKLSVESLRNIIDKKFLSVKNAKGLHTYPQLRMYPTKFQNFLFWKVEEDFEIGNHVMMYEKAKDNNRIWTEEDLQKIQQNLIRKQWARRSPWEILIIPNYRSRNCGTREVTVLCLRFHRAIGNELSWMKLFGQCLCDSGSEPDVHISPTYPSSTFITTHPPLTPNNTIIDKVTSKTVSAMQTPFSETRKKACIMCRRILQNLLIPFKVPYDFAEFVMEPFYTHDWQVDDRSLLKRDHVVTLDRFSVQHVKEIKNVLGVSFSSVLMAALSSALRVTFMEAGFKIPSHMKILLPFPFGNVTRKSPENDGSLSWSLFDLPIGVSSSRERLRYCEASQKELEKSTKLVTNRFILSLIGLLPFKYHWNFLQKRSWAGVLINLKGSDESLNISDHQIEDVIMSSASDAGFAFSFVSYADYLRMSVVIDYRLLPNELMAKNLLKNIYAELVLLGIDGAAAVV